MTGRPGRVFPAAPVQGNAARGKQVFLQHCARCHGEDGSGEGPGTGVTLSRERSFMIMPPAINNSGFLQAVPDAMIRHTVETGRAGGGMPAFKGKLSEEQIKDVVAYVRSFEQARKEQHGPVTKASPAHIVESPRACPLRSHLMGP